MSNPIFFLHIWKTGGTTLATRLSGAFPLGRAAIYQGSLYHPQNIDQLKQLISTHDFTQAHVHGPLLDGIDGVDVLCAVRNPINRMISAYREMRRYPEGDFSRPAKKLSPLNFFRAFGEIFRNDQTNAIVTAMINTHGEPYTDRFLTDSLFSVVDRIRWVVPTEAIDEFIYLWSFETGIRVPFSEERENQAPDDDVNTSALREIILEMPHLYALDLHLWQVVRDRYDSYRRYVIESRVGATHDQNNATRAFFNNGSGIWLVESWYVPILNSEGIAEWASGPNQISTIKVVRNHGETEFQCVVMVVLGISVLDIQWFWERTSARLSPKIEYIDNGRARVTIDISNFGPEEVLRLFVPRVSSLIQEHDSEHDTRRWAYKLAQFSLS